MKYLENIIKMLPLGALFLIVSSSLKLIIYYNQFNISIMDYIELDEVIVSFIDDMLFYTLLFGISILVKLWADNMPKSKLQILNENLKKIKSSSKNDLIRICDRISKVYDNMLTTIKDNEKIAYKDIILSIKTYKEEFDEWLKTNLGNLEEINDFKKNRENNRKYLNQLSGHIGNLEEITNKIEIKTTTSALKGKKRAFRNLVIVFIFSLVVLLLIPMEFSLKFIILSLLIYSSLMLVWNIVQDTSFQINYYIIPIIGILIYTICNAYADVYNIKENANKRFVKIEFKNNLIIKTNSENIYIGKTNKYVFLFNLITKESKAYNADEISNITSRK